MRITRTGAGGGLGRLGLVAQGRNAQQLFHKTGVRTRSQLVRIALEQYRDQL